MSASGVPPPLVHLAGRGQPTAVMPPNEEDEDQQMSDSEEMPYIKCEAVYGEDDEDDDMSALPFVRTEMREEEDEDEEDKMKFGMKAPEVGAYVKCSVPSCHSYFEVGNPKYEGFSHFKFPEDPNLRRRWIGIIGQKEDWKPEGAMICSNHFPENSFVNVVECIQETGQLMSKRTLKPGALPTINLELPVSWNMQRLVLPPNNGAQAVTPVSPAVLPRLAPAPVPPPTPIRSPYCQGRAITLTKNGKRRGRPPKNRLPDDFSPNLSISQIMANSVTSTPTAPSLPVKTETAASSVISTPSSSTNGVVKQSPMAQSQVSVAAPPNNLYGMNKQLPPFHLLGMGKRKRGRPRKEDALKRMAESAAVDGVMGWRTWRRNVPNKRRKLLPASLRPQQDFTPDQQSRMIELECNVDINNFLNISMNEDSDGDKPSNPERDLKYFNSLASSISDLTASSLAELRRIIQMTVERLRRSEAVIKEKREEVEWRRNEASKSESCTKEKRLEMDVKIPPSVSIKAVGPRLSHQNSSVVEEEPVPALTITIKREKTNGVVQDSIPAPVLSVIKMEPSDSVKKEPDSSSVEKEEDDDRQGEREENGSEYDHKDGSAESESDQRDVDDAEQVDNDDDDHVENDDDDDVENDDDDNVENDDVDHVENDDAELVDNDDEDENDDVENGEASSTDSEDGSTEVNGEAKS